MNVVGNNTRTDYSRMIYNYWFSFLPANHIFITGSGRFITGAVKKNIFENEMSYNKSFRKNVELWTAFVKKS